MAAILSAARGGSGGQIGVWVLGAEHRLDVIVKVSLEIASQNGFDKDDCFRIVSLICVHRFSGQG